MRVFPFFCFYFLKKLKTNSSTYIIYADSIALFPLKVGLFCFEIENHDLFTWAYTYYYNFLSVTFFYFLKNFFFFSLHLVCG